ncbi:hypothetical protein EJD97_013827 [Solanum chilense]|uniref:Uncharacterized protein n=1 Tax=Solanum chilense TaxID=4083 RepID=A0A6N2AF90_SOLCI|nr:hypothetical protein EJD97_013827 [Solanum chilense]
MSKKCIETSRKSLRSVEGTISDEFHVPSFNISTQTPSPKIVKNMEPAIGSSAQSKVQKVKKKRCKDNRDSGKSEGKEEEGKIVETPSALIMTLLMK